MAVTIAWWLVAYLEKLLLKHQRRRRPKFVRFIGSWPWSVAGGYRGLCRRPVVKRQKTRSTSPRPRLALWHHTQGDRQGAGTSSLIRSPNKFSQQTPANALAQQQLHRRDPPICYSYPPGSIASDIVRPRAKQAHFPAHTFIRMMVTLGLRPARNHPVLLTERRRVRDHLMFRGS